LMGWMPIWYIPLLIILSGFILLRKIYWSGD
jgi:hypothetical protein